MSYLSDLKSKLSAQQYNALVKPLMYTANENFGGEVQDYQAQLLMPLDTKKVGAPTQIEFTKPSTRVVDFGDGGFEVPVDPVPINEDKYSVTYGSDEYRPSFVSSYRSNTPTNINGVPVYATYDSEGKLTGYEGDPAITSWINGNQRIIGSWDATGKPNPQTSTSDKGGFVSGIVDNIMSDPIMGTLASIAAANYGGPLGSAALQLAQGKSFEDALKAAALTVAAQEISGSFGADPNAVGGVTGPDNIDVGGGFNPAAGATPEQFASAIADLDGAVSTPVDLSYPVGTELPPLPSNSIYDYAEPSSINDVINEIASSPTSNPVYDYADPSVPTASDITENIAGNPDRAAMNSNAGYGDTLTSSQISAVDAAVASGMSFADALNYVRGGLLVNSVIGDPLGLSGSTGGGSTASGSTGFKQVPIPAEWRSPTYAASTAPIDLNSIFTDQNLLAGTQFQGLATQAPNISFNDIFASGQQQTPMGNMVDINQIVSAILGQAATSQKSA